MFADCGKVHFISHHINITHSSLLPRRDTTHIRIMPSTLTLSGHIKQQLPDYLSRAPSPVFLEYIKSTRIYSVPGSNIPHLELTS